METIEEIAKQYCSLFAKCNLTEYDLEQAFANGAKWMVGQRIDERTLLKIKERQKKDKVIIEVEL